MLETVQVEAESDALDDVMDNYINRGMIQVLLE